MRRTAGPEWPTLRKLVDDLIHCGIELRTRAIPALDAIFVQQATSKTEGKRPMRHCPHCHHPTIPAWHAHLGSLLTKPITCPNCRSTLVRRTGWTDSTVMAPLVVVLLFLHYENYYSIPTHLIWFLVICAGLSGMCLWIHTIRYDVMTDDVTSAPTRPRLRARRRPPTS